MKNFYLTILLLVGVVACFVTCDDSSDESHESHESKSHESRESHESKSHESHEHDDSKEKGNDKEKYPCGRESDQKCAKKYLHERAACAPVHKTKDQIVYDHNIAMPVPKANLLVVTTTITLSNFGESKILQVIKHSNGDVTYIIQFVNIKCWCPLAYFAMYEKCKGKCKEHKVVSSDVTGFYSFTAAVKFQYVKGEPFTFKNVKISVYVDKAAKYLFGKEITESTDSVVLESVKSVEDHPLTVTKQVLRIKSLVIVHSYLKAVVADFGDTVGIPYDASAIENIVNCKKDKHHIVDLCKDREDKEECLRDVFGEHGCCNRRCAGALGDIHRRNVLVHSPSNDASLWRGHDTLSNITNAIESVQWNHDTNNLIICLRLSLILQSTGSELTVIKKDGTLLTAVGTSYGKYPPYVTMVIPLRRGKGCAITLHSLLSAVISVCFPDHTYVDFGGDIKDNKNPVINKAVKNIIKYPVNTAEEIWTFSDAFNIIREVIQTLICDYGQTPHYGSTPWNPRCY